MKTGCMNCGSDHPMYSCLGLLAFEPDPPKKLTTEESRKLVIAQVVSWYADHQIVRETENSWLLKNPKTSENWAEVVSLAAGTLLVHGDHDPVMFGNMTDCRRPENVVHWMARESPDEEQFIQKAQRALGLNADELIWNQTIERFREELEEMVAEAKKEDPGDLRSVTPWCEDLQAILDDAYECSDDHEIRRLQDDIVSCRHFESEWVPNGRVISARMIHAWAIIRRLSALLKARDEEMSGGPLGLAPNWPKYFIDDAARLGMTPEALWDAFKAWQQSRRVVAEESIEAHEQALDPITDRQREVLVCIRSSLDDHGYAPSMREIADAIGIQGLNGVNDHLKALIRKGYIEKDSQKSRALRLTKGAMVITNASKKEGSEP